MIPPTRSGSRTEPIARAAAASLTARRGAGFTLIELAVVIAVVGLLLGVILVPLGTQFELRQIRDEEERQVTIRQALLGFAVTRGRLPCPDNDGDGVEDINTAPDPDVCVAAAGDPYEGFLPHASLGVAPGDTWARRYLYRVDADFIMAAAPGAVPPSASSVDLSDAAGITVLYRNEAKVAITIADGAPANNSGAAALFVAFGRNGLGATTVDGVALAAPPAGTDELENANNDTTYLTRLRTPDPDGACSETAAGAFCEYDDMVGWIPKNVFFTRMIEAGWLP